MKTDSEKIKIVESIRRDFETRKNARKNLELQWQLNIDYLNGKQNNFVASFDIVKSLSKKYFWQQSEVFNHIAPLVESRLAKLAVVKEEISVVPLSESEEDKVCAVKCEKIIKSAFKKVNMKSLVDQANMWAEMTGTAFYKVVWNNQGGRIVGEISGEPLKEGDVEIIVCSPFEIYPDSLSAGDVEQVSSIIHARPYTVEQIKRIWGVDVAGSDVEIYDFNKSGRAVLGDAVMVIERYKDGELVIIAGDKILFRGAYEGQPFVRQTCEATPTSFYGKSVIERAIPVQRALNACKNRKIEFMNRLACGVLAVEQNSVDVEALENDGLAPGTIVEYKVGAKVPQFITGDNVPSELEREEERLLSELATITNGSDITRGDFANVSGVALEIMVAQDQLRIRRALLSGQNARVLVARKLLRLYRKYATEARIDRLVRGKIVEVFTWSKNDIKSDEVVLGGEENE